MNVNQARRHRFEHTTQQQKLQAMKIFTFVYYHTSKYNNLMQHVLSTQLQKIDLAHVAALLDATQSHEGGTHQVVSLH
jgi:aminopeptidase C